MQSKAATVEQYLSSLPDDRRAAISAVREVFLKNLDKGYAEGMTYGMIGYFVPHTVYPAGYHCDPKQPLPFAGLASQKGHMSLYLMGLYAGTTADQPTPLSTWFQTAWGRTGKKLDMGKACIRFKKLDDLALDVIAEAIRRQPSREFIKQYEHSRDAHQSKKQATARTAASRPSKQSSRAPARSAVKKVTKKKQTRARR